MVMKFTKVEFGTGTSEILQFPEPFVAVAQVLPQNSSLAATVGSRKIVKAGTLYPSAAAPVGLILNDADVTDGDANAALLIEGYVNTAKLPTALTDAQKELLPKLTFFPLVARVKAITSIAASTGIAVSTTGGVATISATGIQEVAAGDGIDVATANGVATVSVESAG